MAGAGDQDFMILSTILSTAMPMIHFTALLTPDMVTGAFMEILTEMWLSLITTSQETHVL